MKRSKTVNAIKVHQLLEKVGGLVTEKQFRGQTEKSFFLRAATDFILLNQMISLF
jgi:hypothetical protein